MGCRLDNFDVKTWETIQHRGHVVEVAPAQTLPIPGFKARPLKGVVYKLDGVFQGFTGNKDAAIYWVDQKLEESKTLTLKATIEATRDRELDTCYEASIIDEAKNEEIDFLYGYRIKELEREIRKKYPKIEIERENF